MLSTFLFFDCKDSELKDLLWLFRKLSIGSKLSHSDWIFIIGELDGSILTMILNEIFFCTFLFWISLYHFVYLARFLDLIESFKFDCLLLIWFYFCIKGFTQSFWFNFCFSFDCFVWIFTLIVLIEIFLLLFDCHVILEISFYWFKHTSVFTIWFWWFWTPQLQRFAGWFSTLIDCLSGLTRRLSWIHTQLIFKISLEYELNPQLSQNCFVRFLLNDELIRLLYTIDLIVRFLLNWRSCFETKKNSFALNSLFSHDDWFEFSPIPVQLFGIVPGQVRFLLILNRKLLDEWINPVELDCNSDGLMRSTPVIEFDQIRFWSHFDFHFALDWWFFVELMIFLVTFFRI